jgi:hypothetical protein
MSLNIDRLFRFRANQCLLFLLNDVCLAKKQQITIVLSWLTKTEPLLYIVHTYDGRNVFRFALEVRICAFKVILRKYDNSNSYKGYTFFGSENQSSWN